MKPHQVINKDTLTRSNKVNQKMIFIHSVLKLIQEECKTLSCRLFEKIYLTHTELKGHLINVLSATQNLIKL